MKIYCPIITPRMGLQETVVVSKLSFPMLQKLEELRRKTCKPLENLEVSDPAGRVDMFDLGRAKSSEPLMRNRLVSSIFNKIAALWQYHHPKSDTAWCCHRLALLFFSGYRILCHTMPPPSKNRIAV